MHMIALDGHSALSPFRLDHFNARLDAVQRGVRVRAAWFVYFVETGPALDDAELARLREVLGAGSGEPAAASVWVTPRLGTISPWSSKATDIVRECNFDIVRVERGVAYRIDGLDAADDDAVHAVYMQLHDTMTQSVIESLDAAEGLFLHGKPGPLERVELGDDPHAALEKANRELGLALAEDEITYLVERYAELERAPSDAELMMFAQANSEHCRHKVFNATWNVDAKPETVTLFGMIRHTHKHAPAHTLSAYSDNAAVIAGGIGRRFFPDPEQGIWQASEEQVDFAIKVETHNHPTAIAPWPGAATGAGGEIRDEGATGRGGKPKAGLTGFSVSHLRIPELPRPWEHERPLPPRYASAFEIMRDGPLGAAAYNNEFGRPCLGGYFRSFETENGKPGVRRGYDKPIMIAGGLANLRRQHVEKGTLLPGDKVIVLGGPAMLIGLGGGAASSMAGGSSSDSLDFASVQRDNPEMERRCQEVIDRCWQQGRDNPVLAIHDVGAGGLSNAFPELVNDAGRGAVFDLRQVHVEESGLSAAEIWSNESQERYVLAVLADDLPRFDVIARRERCPYAVVGVATQERQLRVTRGEGIPGVCDAVQDKDVDPGGRPVDVPVDVILGKPPRMVRDVRREHGAHEPLELTGIALDDAAQRVLRHPTVANKTFLVTIGDRSVGGLSSRDQMVGPWQVPVADCAVTLSGFDGTAGQAMAMGERTPVAVIDAAASGRLAVTEALTNIVAGDIANIRNIKLSANWMAACGEPGQDAALYDTVAAVSDWCQSLGLSIPVGKDSLSMRTSWTDAGTHHSVVAPVSLVATAFAPVADARATLTPQLRTDCGDTVLLLIDLGKGRKRLGGSVLAQVYNQVGTEVPDVDDPVLVLAFFHAVRELAAKGQVLAYHDRSDGGLWATLCEMAFAGHTGVSLNLDMLTIDPNAQDAGDYKIKADQLQVQRDELTLGALFAEEAGAVLQVARDQRDLVLQYLRDLGLSAHTHVVGALNDKDEIQLLRDGQYIYRKSRVELARQWSEVSRRIMARRDNPACAQAEFDVWAEPADPGLSPVVGFDPQDDVAAPYIATGVRPKVAILREQGCNSQVEMAWAFDKAGFEALDVHMTDLLSGRVNLDAVRGLVAVGGFSYGDVLGAGEGWARTIRFNSRLSDQFAAYFGRTDTFALGVCNGCQMMAALAPMIPGARHWPRFTRNLSEKYEARLSLVEIPESPSVFMRGMAGTRVPVAVAHGEGYANFSRQGDARQVQGALYFVDNNGNRTERYPYNPNGSGQGLAGVTTADGRFTVLMPHPERVTRNAMMSWAPGRWGAADTGGDASPWLRMFRNARVWVG
jgi:phosphoribosylformylglycinamidine synthase